MNLLGTFMLFGFFLLPVWALTTWPMSFERAAIIVILLVLAEVRWHQPNRSYDSAGARHD